MCNLDEKSQQVKSLARGVGSCWHGCPGRQSQGAVSSGCLSLVREVGGARSPPDRGSWATQKEPAAAEADMHRDRNWGSGLDAGEFRARRENQLTEGSSRRFWMKALTPLQTALRKVLRGGLKFSRFHHVATKGRTEVRRPTVAFPNLRRRPPLPWNLRNFHPLYLTGSCGH